MRLPHYIVDAFTCGAFTGNPAAVVPLEEWIDESAMQAIAGENNLSETAFVLRTGSAEFDLRWFTPTVEIELCGHATLATAHVLVEEVDELAGASIAEDVALRFATRSGELEVARERDLYSLKLPAVEVRAMDASQAVLDALGAGEGSMLSASKAGDLLVVYEDESSVRAMAPDLQALMASGAGFTAVTAPAAEYDFVTRVFAPRVGIDEDPATGSAQCALAPYWSKRLDKPELRCFQASRRGAELGATWVVGDDRVTVSGRCTTFVRGELELSAD